MSHGEKRHLIHFTAAERPAVYVLILIRRTNNPTTVHVRSYAQHDILGIRGYYPLNTKKWKSFAASQHKEQPVAKLLELAQLHADLYRTGDLQEKVIWGNEKETWRPCSDLLASRRVVVPRRMVSDAPASLASPFTLPIIKAGTGHTDEAFELLEHARLKQAQDQDKRVYAGLGTVAIATDASGRGSWASIINLPTRTFRIGGASVYQDHIAEMYAVVAALEWLPGHHETVDIVTDCKGTVHALNSGAPQPRKQAKKSKRATAKWKRQQQEDALKKRFHQAARNHGHVGISYRPRTTTEITAAHDLAAELGQALREHRESATCGQRPTHHQSQNLKTTRCATPGRINTAADSGGSDLAGQRLSSTSPLLGGKVIDRASFQTEMD